MRYDDDDDDVVFTVHGRNETDNGWTMDRYSLLYNL